MESYENLSDEAESHGERLQEEGERVGKNIEDTKSDWEAKKADSGVPGAVPDSDEPEDEEKPTEAQSERGEAPDSAGQ